MTTYYNIYIADPDSHYAEVEAVFSLGAEEALDVSLPTWTPGSYMIRDYVQHVSNVHAHLANVASDGSISLEEAIDVDKTERSTWHLSNPRKEDAFVALKYRVYCHELGDFSPRCSYVTDQLAFLHFPSLLVVSERRRSEKIELSVGVSRPDWDCFTGLKMARGEGNFRLEAPSFDTLIDAPVVLGDLPVLSFEVDGVKHRFVTSESLENLLGDTSIFINDISKIVAANRSYFGYFPYDSYLFFLFIAESAGGGLEHHNSSINVYPRNRIAYPDKAEAPYPGDSDYAGFLTLFAHEHFHAWNVKAFGPAGLCCPDLLNGTDTTDIWTVEGFASYFEKLTLLRAKLVDPTGFLTLFVRAINAYESLPAKFVDSLEESGRDAWVRLYRPSENTPNTTISYYLGGMLVCLMLDLDIARLSDWKHSLIDVVRALSEFKYNRDGSSDCCDSSTACGGGYEKGFIKKVLAKYLSESYLEQYWSVKKDGYPFFVQFFNRFPEETWSEERLGWASFDEALKVVGAQVERSDAKPDWSLGLKFKPNSNDLVVSEVRRFPLDSASGEAAPVFPIYPGDTILAVNGWRVKSSDAMEKVVKNGYVLGDEGRGEREPVYRIHLFRNGQIKEVTLDQRLVRTSVSTVSCIEVVEDEAFKKFEAAHQSK